MKLLDKLIRYEHKEWIKLHKIHLSAASVAVLAIAVITGVVFADSKPTTAATPTTQPQTQDAATSNQASQNSPVATTTQPSATTTTSSTPAAPASSTTASTPIYKATVATPTKSLAPSTSSQIPSPTQQPTSPATLPTTPPLTLEKQYPSDYPSQWANAPVDSIVDNWGMWNREDVSYTAWKVNETFGFMPYGFGNAIKWPSEAQSAGFTVSQTPAVHTVGIETTQPVAETGLSVWIEAVDTADSTVTYSAYGDINNRGTYDVQTVPISTFQYYINFKS